MRISTACHAGLLACAALAMAPAASAADVGNCLNLVTRPGADAALTNVCTDWLNLMYCIDGGQATPACTDKPKDVVTLMTGDSVPLPGYDGRAGRLRWAVCAYPEAPVGWQPAQGEAYVCKKTCVMC